MLALGAFSRAERRQLVNLMNRLAARGIVRSTAGTAAASIWTLAPNPPAPRRADNHRGAAELAAAHARAAAALDQQFQARLSGEHVQQQIARAFGRW